MSVLVFRVCRKLVVGCGSQFCDGYVEGWGDGPAKTHEKTMDVGAICTFDQTIPGLIPDTAKHR